MALSVLFVVLNAFFVAAEFALVKIRVTRLEILSKKGNTLAKLAEKMVHNLDPYLSSTQLGITLASLGLGWVGEPAFARILANLLVFLNFNLDPISLHSISFVFAFSTISALHIILGELVPKSIAIRMPETVCLYIAYPLHIFYKVFFPFLWILNTLSNSVLKLIGMPPVHGSHRAHSEEELKLIVEDSFEEGTIGRNKWTLLDRALDFSHTTIKDIMVPKKEMVAMTLEDPLEKNLSIARDSEHTRFPVRAHKKGPIVGFVHMKDVIWNLDHAELINLYDLVRPLATLHEGTALDKAILVFQKKRVHMAIVLNKAEQQVGLVTLEDVIEELVGEIEDEFDD